MSVGAQRQNEFAESEVKEIGIMHPSEQREFSILIYSLWLEINSNKMSMSNVPGLDLRFSLTDYYLLAKVI